MFLFDLAQLGGVLVEDLGHLFGARPYDRGIFHIADIVGKTFELIVKIVQHVMKAIGFGFIQNALHFA
ncbi:hypothetical protein SDC9_212658 [bioreactor metagenome]|uniref:Uncharacterized protein n=1 Tax=bioreactor metagenome TaxID=1076179 RepID=A0A645JP87_9ZZZZ